MDEAQLRAHVEDPARLRALRAVALLDTPTEEAFDRLSRLAARFVGAPVALVSLVDADRQFFKSCIGLPEPWGSTRETPLSHSFCQHNQITGRPLLIPDAREHPLFRDNPAIEDMGVVAYLGIPLVTDDSYVLGSFCVIDHEPRAWIQDDVDVVRDLAAAVMTEIQLRTEIAARRRAEGEREELVRLNDQLEEMHRRLLQSQKLESLGLLAGGVAHDCNNLFTVVLGHTRLAMTGLAGGSPAKEHLAAVETAVQRGSELVSQLLAYAGRAPVAREHCELNGLVSEMVCLVEATAGGGVELDLDLEPGLPAVQADTGKLRQAILNLLTNAMEAIGDATGVVTVRTRSFEADTEALASPYIPGEPSPGPHVSLEVVDGGKGMEAAALERLFDPFFTTKERGHGLGLAAILGTVRCHGGSIRVDSDPGRGSRFQLLLPAPGPRD